MQDDLISRQAVINIMANTNFWLSVDNWKELMKAIDSIPPVQPELFINKPCVSEQACRDDKMKVLDKIRADIKKAVWEDVIYSFDGSDEVIIPRLDPDDVFEIIDKYMKESEESNG